MREKAGSIDWKATSLRPRQSSVEWRISEQFRPITECLAFVWMSLFLKNPVALLEMDSNEGRHRRLGDWCSLDIMLAF